MPDERLPPGQYEANGWPALHFGEVPVADAATWRFRIHGAVRQQRILTLEEFRSLPTADIHADFHCVTKFSVFDNDWYGVRPAEVLSLVESDPAASHVMVEGMEGYTTNLPLGVFDDDDTVFAWQRNGENLTPEHGWPLRLVVPKRYAWKSVKWVSGLEILVGDRRGFWEERGYHNQADPWNEERYSYQETA
ncbi:MAG: molybdopterin-dependent oxidoreductase [Nitriliruptorales bacterium]|nr:molybdopterin-dependent oxidoreductase [Nitriliruptorales bacterium]